MLPDISLGGASYQFPTLSPNGEYVAARSGLHSSIQAVVVWESRTGREVKRLPSTPFVDYDYGFSNDGRYLVVPNGANVQILDLQTRQINTIQNLIRTRRNVLSPDSKHLLTLSQDLKLLQVWNVADGGREFSTQLDLTVLYDLQFTPDSKYLIVGGDLTLPNRDGSFTKLKPQVQFIAWQAEDLIAKACGRVTRNLTADEWKQYFGSVQYHKTCPNID
jgi:WD40 repeat protein